MTATKKNSKQKKEQQLQWRSTLKTVPTVLSTVTVKNCYVNEKCRLTLNSANEPKARKLQEKIQNSYQSKQNSNFKKNRINYPLQSTWNRFAMLPVSRRNFAELFQGFKLTS